MLQVKQRQGRIDRIAPDRLSAICKHLLKKETDMSVFEGSKVVTGKGEQGIIGGRFGGSGRCRIHFSECIAPANERRTSDNEVFLIHKKYVYDPDRHRIWQ